MKDEKKKSWMSTLFAYAEGEKKRMYLSVVLSVLSVAAGLAPFYCMYAMLCLFVAGTATAAGIIKWCLLALLAYAVKILLFSLSTGVSHAMAYTILEALRLRLADGALRCQVKEKENEHGSISKRICMGRCDCSLSNRGRCRRGWKRPEHLGCFLPHTGPHLSGRDR